MTVQQRSGLDQPGRPFSRRARAPRTGRCVLAGLSVVVVLCVLALTAPAEAAITAAALGKPGKPTAVAGDGEATVTITPATTGGAVAGYTVKANSGGLCYIVTPDIACTVPYLYNDVPVSFTSYSYNAAFTEYSAPSVASDIVTPGAAGSPTDPTSPSTPTAIPAPTNVSAVAGIASVKASWSAVSGAVDYTATTTPGGVSCQVTGTTCVLGAIAGTSTRVRVVAHAVTGDSAASTASAAVTPKIPAVPAVLPDSAQPTLTTPDGQIGLAAAGQAIFLAGSGFAPFSSIQVAIYSAPITLGAATTDSSGAFSTRVLVPDALPTGKHTLMASGAEDDGDSRIISMPITVAATEAGSHGKAIAKQTGTLPIPVDGSVTLLDANDQPATTVVVAGGTYTLKASTGTVTFTPTSSFTGVAPSIHYLISDALGTSVNGTYTAVVTTVPAAAKPRLKLPGRLLSTVGSSPGVTVGCSIPVGAVARCIVTVTAVVDGDKTVVGYGVTTPAVTKNLKKVTVKAGLTELGRYLAARPGGAKMTFAAELIQRGHTGSRSVSASSVVEAKRYGLVRFVAFDSNSATLADGEALYLEAANDKLHRGIGLKCVGHAGSRERNPGALAERRARTTCAEVAKGLGADLHVSGQVEPHPTGAKNTPLARSYNRRVTVTVTN